MGAAALPIAIGVIGGVYGSYAADQEGRDQERYYNFLSDQNEKRAALTLKRGNQQVSAIQDVASNEDEASQRNAAVTRGAQKAAFGASGVSADSVTAEDVARDTDRAANIDEEAIRFNADAKSQEAITGAQDAAQALRDQAQQYRMAGFNARRAGRLNSVSSILNGATSMADNWYRWNRTSKGAGNA